MPSGLPPGRRTANLPRPWLFAYALLLVSATFVLIGLGGTVTSRDAALAVPDWPTSYGYNMFLFPPSLWVEGIFWEHLHRLSGTVVGMLTIGMMLWLWLIEDSRRWLRWFGVALLVLVIVQGVMGGLRVTELSITLAIVHGITGQVFFCLTVLLAVAVGTERRSTDSIGTDSRPIRHLRVCSLIFLGVLLVQLVLGAGMRHNDGGLAIPDFPTSYGRWIPPLTQQQLDEAMVAVPYDRTGRHFTADYSVAAMAVHFSHRLWAMAVLAVAGWMVVRIGRLAVCDRWLKGIALALIALLIAQVALGVSVIWSGRLVDLATAHQVVGAAVAAVSTLLAARLYHLPVDRWPARAVVESAGRPAAQGRFQGSGA